MTVNAQFWDERYGSREQLFSGNPNGVLVTEAADLPPGRALDVGCGEGADARWLAAHGWRVTGVDVSQVALDRAAAFSDGITYVRADLAVDAPPAGPFDLVSAHYVPLERTAGHAALRRLLATVAPGGTLLFVSHDLSELPPAAELELDPHDFYQPGEVAKLLRDGWTVLADETRPRTAAAPPGAHHTRDTVLRAVRS